MRMSGRLAAMLLIGLGLGTIAGAYLRNARAWSGLALIMVGIGVAIVGRFRATGDVARIPVEPAREPAAPRLSGLGTRVEQILRLAERQAEQHSAESKREAEQIVANAQAEAQTIIEKARQQAP